MGKKIKAKNKNCTKYGCEAWEYALMKNQPFFECETCGFNPKEEERRKAIPLTLCEDGLRRKLIG